MIKDIVERKREISRDTMKEKIKNCVKMPGIERRISQSDRNGPFVV